MKWCFCFFISFLFAVNSFCKDIKIGVYRSHKILELNFIYSSGDYMIYGDDKYLGLLNKNSSISVSKNGNLVGLKKGREIIGNFKQVSIQPVEFNGSIELHPQRPKLIARAYRDAFIISAEKTGLTIINNVTFNNYLGGVLESEGGHGKHIEYYKAQAVLSRTYALRHFNRHAKEGFNLCDQVHCQAYYKLTNQKLDIQEAVQQTNKIYIADTVSHEPIEGYFHANCGGETSGSDFVWRENITYLQPIKDTFCINSVHSHWEEKILKTEWQQYLTQQFFYPTDDSIYKKAIFNFEQAERKAFYLSPHLGIPLRDLRYRFNLKSTFFSCHPYGEYVIVTGKGFGHGVGLCQEGAMQMAKSGFNYQQILAFYFKGIQFKTTADASFFHQPVSEDFMKF